MASESKREEHDYARDQLPNYYRSNGHLGHITTDTGNPVYDRSASLTVGRTGPIALEDALLVEELAHFARERIPERVVHAKGASAAGEFTCTADITALTSACVFSAVGKVTPMRVRFSTVAGNLGNADTVRDPRGFALKFQTEQGTWDLVGNNTPIFFIRDPILFPMLVHTQKRNPVTHLRDPNAFWDFASLRPETTHQLLILMSDRGIPDGHRHMHGYGSHTFSLVNAEEKKTYCKFHYKTQQGIKNLTVAEAAKLAGTSPDYGIKDLYNAIEGGNYPKWTMYIQTMTEEQARDAPFDPFDVTKVWPQAAYPLREVGKFVLNKNPDNYFAEVEQLAFSPSHFIPGIGPSQDRLLLGRIFSYPDALRYRLGTNFAQLPVNAPYAVQNFQRDGVANTDNQAGAPNYHPNSFGGPDDDVRARRGYPVVAASGLLARYDTGGDGDNFAQARVLYRSVFKPDERQRVADNVVDSLRYAVRGVQKRVVQMFGNVDEDLATRIADGLRAESLKVAL